MNSIRILVSMLLVMLACMAANAQAVDEPMRHLQGYIETSFQNTMNLGFEVGLKYHPIRYVGIGAGVGIGGGDIGEPGTITFEAGDMMVIADDGDGVVWFSTGLQLQSPALWRSSDGDGGLSLKADAGIRLPVPANDKLVYRAIPNAAGTWEEDWQYERNHGGKSCFLYFKPSVAYEVHRCQIWLGYLWSNMDPYSGVRNVTILGHHLDFPRKRPMHGLTIGFGYRF